VCPDANRSAIRVYRLRENARKKSSSVRVKRRHGFAPTNGGALATDYVNYTFIATATSTSTILSITGQYLDIGGTGTLLDDVSVTAVSSAVPEPATLGLTGLGCLALFTARRLLITPARRVAERYLPFKLPES
jgi:hypothetical protein